MMLISSLRLKGRFEKLLRSSPPPVGMGTLHAYEVKRAVKPLKKKKACGQDRIFNEHLIYGGSVLLANVFYTHV